jgi:hypothetical protein
LLIAASSARSRSSADDGSEEIQIRLGQFMLSVRLRHVPKTRMSRKLARTDAE